MINNDLLLAMDDTGAYVGDEESDPTGDDAFSGDPTGEDSPNDSDDPSDNEGKCHDVP